MIDYKSCSSITPTQGMFVSTDSTSTPTPTYQSCNNYTITAASTGREYSFDFTEIVLRARIKEVREGWNSPKQQPLPIRPIVNNIRKCYRSNI